MRQLEEMLGDAPFVRVSSGQMANMEHVSVVQTDSVCMTDGTVLYFSRRRRSGALEALTCYLSASAY